jgi:apolipoprotein N-acyltransferase
MFRVPIHSRVGNAGLAVLGVVYFVAATATLIYYIATSWGAMGLIDYALQLALVASAIGGLFFLAIAAQNLGFTRSRAERPRSSPDHRTAPAAGS